MRKLSFLCVLLTVAAIAVAMGIPADGAVIQTDFNKLGFRDFENLYDSQSNGMFDVGDRLRGVLFLDKLDAGNGVSYGGTDPPFPHEVTAIIDIEVRHVNFEGFATGPGIIGENEIYSVLFGPASAPGAAGTEMAAAIGAPGGNGWVPAGTVFNPLGPLSTLPGMPVLPPGTPEPMIVAYEGPPDNLVRAAIDTSTLLAETNASDGTLLGAFTMLADVPGAPPIAWGAPGNGYWVANVAVNDPAGDGVANTPIPIGFAGTTSFAFGLEAIPGAGVLSQWPYVKLDNVELTLNAIVGAGTLIAGNVPDGPDGIPNSGDEILFDFTGGGSATPIKSNGSNATGPPAEPGYGIYHADSDDPARLHPTPEPTTIVVWGILAICFGGAAWWRRRRQA